LRQQAVALREKVRELKGALQLLSKRYRYRVNPDLQEVAEERRIARQQAVALREKVRELRARVNPHTKETASAPFPSEQQPAAG